MDPFTRLRDKIALPPPHNPRPHRIPPMRHIPHRLLPLPPILDRLQGRFPILVEILGSETPPILPSGPHLALAVRRSQDLDDGLVDGTRGDEVMQRGIPMHVLGREIDDPVRQHPRHHLPLPFPRLGRRGLWKGRGNVAELAPWLERVEGKRAVGVTQCPQLVHGRVDLHREMVHLLVRGGKTGDV